MNLPDMLPGRWLPEDADHPIRPDLPWFRHLTFAEGHAMEIGIGLAVFLYAAGVAGLFPYAFGVAIVIATKIARTKRNADRPDNPLPHAHGIHDIKADPWYFVVAAIVTTGVLFGIFGGP